MKCTLYILHALSLFVVGETFDGYDSSYAFLNVHNKDSDYSETFCVNYQQWQLRQLPAQLNEANSLGFDWWAQDWNTNVCLRNSTANYSGKVVPGEYRLQHDDRMTCPVVLQGDDAFTKFTTWQAREADKHHSSALLLLVKRGMKYFKSFDDYLYSQFAAYPFNASSVGVSIFFTYNETFYDKIMLVGGGPPKSLEFRFYRPPSAVLDGALFAVFFTALFCVIVGGLWSGHRRKTIWLTEARDAGDIDSVMADTADAFTRAVDDNDEDKLDDIALPDGAVDNEPTPSQTRANRAKSSGHREQAAQSMNSASVLCYIGFIVLLIVVLYFFYKYLVWVLIVLYVFAATMATYSCLSEALEPVKCGRCRICLSLNQCLRCELVPWEPCRARPLVRDMLIFVGAATLSICWAIFRKWAFAFILQDILSIFFCIHLIKTLRIPNLMYLTLLLGGLLIYDLFMVFITPYLTADGCSIMVKVATGGAGCSPSEDMNNTGYPVPPVWKETLPILFKYPRMSDPMLQCYDLSVDLQYPPMMLGLGDVIVPGFLVGFCFAIDYIYKTKFLYGAISCLGYAVGLVVTFTSLLLMESAQPALIYLVPCTWIPIVITALFKRQFCVLWKGTMPSPAEMTGIISAPTATTNLDEQDNDPRLPE